MKNFKKLSLMGFLFIFLISFAFVGCGKKTEEIEDFQTDKDVEITQEDEEALEEDDDSELSENGEVIGDENIRIHNLKEGDVLSFPLTLTGEAVGLWYFEASFVVSVLNEKGEVLAVTPAQSVTGDWMTVDFVDFEAIFDEVDLGGAKKGTLLFEKYNPTGFLELDQSFEVEVKFE